MNDQSILEQVRAIVVEQGWSLRLKKCWGKEYVFATRSSGQHSAEQRYIGPLDDLASPAAQSRARRLSEPLPVFSNRPDDCYICFRNDGNARSESWRKTLVKMFSDACMRCGWNLASCDAHHLLPKSKGGKQTLENGVLLCPNCHRLADCGLISTEELKHIRNSAVPQRQLWRVQHVRGEASQGTRIKDYRIKDIIGLLGPPTK